MSRTPGGRDASDYRGLALAGTAVTEMVAPILVGVWADGHFGWSPWGLAVGAVVGFVGGLAHLIILTRRADGKKSDGGGPGA